MRSSGENEMCVITVFETSEERSVSSLKMFVLQTVKYKYNMRVKVQYQDHYNTKITGVKNKNF